MDKKFLGIRRGTIITAVVCLLAAFCIWIYVEYQSTTDGVNAATAQLIDEVSDADC